MADPVYTEAFATWTSDGYGSDGVWSDYDLFTNQGVPKGAVAEIILSNVITNTENLMGVRTDGSGLSRYVNIHECEPTTGYDTHCRMFVVCHATTGLIETYAEDVSDAVEFTLVGYWQNVSFTELATAVSADSSGAWDTETSLAAGNENRVFHVIMSNNESDVSNTMGVRTAGSALERKLVVHEPEAGGSSFLDMFVKTDANADFDLYSSDATNATFILSGYFGTESSFSFVELWQNINATSIGWQEYDLTAYLDQDGRTVDILLSHSLSTGPALMGARGGDSAVDRYLYEHEAEGLSTEYAGFSMLANSNSTGKVDIQHDNTTADYVYLGGYFTWTASGTSYIKFSNETVNVQESLQRARGFRKFSDETVNIQEGTQRAREIRKFSDETENIGEGAGQLSYGFKGVFNETIEAAEGIVKELVEGVGAALNYVINETLNIAHSIQKLLGFAKTSNETVNSSETLQKSVGFVKTKEETENISETSYAQRGLIRTIADTLNIGEALQKAQGLLKHIADTVNIGETLQKAQGFIKEVADTVNIGETLQKARGLLHQIAESVQLSETYQMARGIVQHIADAVQIAEDYVSSLVQGGGEILVKIIDETVNIAHAIQQASGLTRTSDETVNLQETTQSARGLLQQISETVQSSEAYQKARGLLFQIADTLNIQEAANYVTSTLGEIVKIINETIQSIEEDLRLMVMVKTSDETVQIVPSATAEVRVTASADDSGVYWNGSAWAITTSSVNNVLGYVLATSSKWGCGLRFLNVDIPSTATITSAYITLTARFDYAVDTVNVRICGEKQLNPATFSTIANYQTRRGTDVGGADNTLRTSAEVDWDSVSAWTQDTAYQTPSIISVINEIKSQSGWDASTKNMVLFVDDHAGRSTASNNTYRAAHAYDNDPAKAPLLHIEYTLPEHHKSLGYSKYSDETEEISESPRHIRGLQRAIDETLEIADSAAYNLAAYLLYVINEAVEIAEDYASRLIGNLIYIINETVQLAEHTWYAIGIRFWRALTLIARAFGFTLKANTRTLTLQTRSASLTLKSRPNLTLKPRSRSLTVKPH